ncbi:uncharacterized protein LOC118647485 [Monomorium pharaonis]|uniref:uncharacterized protein LOC118647485 n=1 Tax=Monomorium pharaonis TaxID=307658 RepID=UPI0017473911|nr:uncharacterized protein LOC118647485 [Monomorium pharaonis]
MTFSRCRGRRRLLKLLCLMLPLRRTNCELNDKLNQLNSIASSVERNNQRIAALEHECTVLANEVRNLKSELKPVSDQSENSLILSGVPATMPIMAPMAYARNMFMALEIPELSCHILDARTIRKTQSVAASDRPLPVSATGSIIVTLTSRATRDIVITKKRVRRVLVQRDICDNDSDRDVYVNELLPKNTYELLKLTKKIAKEKSYKYVWVRESHIHIRRSDGEPIVHIDSETDLDRHI